MTAIGPIIWRLAQRFRTSGAVKDRPSSDRSKRITPREERYIRITTDLDRFLQATRSTVHAQKESVCLSAGQCSATHRSSVHELSTDQQCQHITLAESFS
jgi:hypothetical protein